MDGVLAVARLIPAVVFAVTGVRRLLDPLEARRGVRAWGVPVRLAGLTVSVLTLVEIGVAVGLLFGASAYPAGIVALGCVLAPIVPAAAAMARRGVTTEALSVVLRAMAVAVPIGILMGEGRPYAGPNILSWYAELPVGPQIAVAVGVAGLAAGVSGVRIRRSPTLPRPDEASSRPTNAEPATNGRPKAVPLIRPAPALTIGMATYDDFDGVYFTVQALRLYHDLDDTELLVVDNYGCEQTRDFVRGWAGGTYVLANDIVGTAAAKDKVFSTASGGAVLCCDSHVLFEAGVIARLKGFYREHPDCGDLLQGPLVYDDGSLVSTHFEPVWRGQMWGVWASDPRGADRDGEPFDIPMQGLGAFSCRSEAWPGFHPAFRGFGGEEGYLHEKFRQAGRRCLCLPWLRWMHRFGRPHGVPYPLTVDDKVRNYLLGHAELGLDPAPVIEHFSRYLPDGRMAALVKEAEETGVTVLPR